MFVFWAILDLRFWHLFQLGLPFSWFTWPLFLSLAPVSTLPGVWGLLLSTTMRRPGMTRLVYSPPPWLPIITVNLSSWWVSNVFSFFLFGLQWIFWVGPFIGAAIAAFYHQFILRAGAVKALGSFRSTAHVWFAEPFWYLLPLFLGVKKKNLEGGEVIGIGRIIMEVVIDMDEGMKL